MSMSKKLMSIVVVMTILAVLILGLGLYSISVFSEEVAAVSRMGNRSVLLNKMDSLMLERRIAVAAILAADDEAGMRVVYENELPRLEQAMEETVQRYESFFPPDPTPELLSYPKAIRALWADYVRVTDEAAKMSMENSNNRAHVLANSLAGIWRDVDARLVALSEKITENSEPRLARLGLKTNNLRAAICFIRLGLFSFINDPDPASFAKVEADILAQIAVVDNTLQEIGALTPAAEGGSEATAILGYLQQNVSPVIGNIISLVKQDTNGKARRLYANEGAQARQKMVEYTDNLLGVADASMLRTVETAVANGRFVTWIMVGISLIGIIFCLGLAWFIVSRIIRNLGEIIDQLGASSREVYAASTHISEASQALAEGATEQASSLEETSSALEQMASMTRQNADNTSQTRETTEQNNQRIGLGEAAVKSMSQSMSEIDDSAEKIGTIIKTIEEIAFNTNLLALNAAVEAARAGEAGKGFAVVADEVRNLAQRSAGAAQDTTRLIQNTIDRVRHGAEIVHNLEESFIIVKEGSQQVSTLIDSIATATSEQAQGVDQVSTAVAQMDKVTQQNAASAEQSASAAMQLSDQASMLNQLVERLIALVEGKNVSLEAKPRLVQDAGAAARTVSVTAVADSGQPNLTLPGKPLPALEDTGGAWK